MIPIVFNDVLINDEKYWFKDRPIPLPLDTG